MNFKLLLSRVIPVSLAVAFLLLQFQNCAKPAGLTNDIQSSGSNPSGDTIDFSSGTPDLPIASVNPGNGGSFNPNDVPNCFEISGAGDEYDFSDPDKYTTLKIRTVEILTDPENRKKTRKNYLDISHATIAFENDGQYYYFSDVKNTPENYREAAFISVPNVMLKKGNKISGVFTGKLFQNLLLNVCGSK